MTLSLSTDRTVVIASLSGDVDMSNTASLSAALTAAMDGDSTALLLDLTAVRYLDSAGVQMVFDIARRLEVGRRGFGLVVEESSPVRSVLKITRVEDVASLWASAEEGIDSFLGAGRSDT